MTATDERRMPQLPAPTRIGQGTAVEMQRAVAEVQAAIIVAQQCPRDVQGAVRAMKDACGRLELAEKAFFRYPRGGEQISGPSVVLARELGRIWGNFQWGVVEMRRDDEAGQSEMLAFAWDVQVNSRDSTTFIVPHVRDTKTGPKPLTDMRDIYENNANNGARRVREMIFGLLPAWLTEEAQRICHRTLENGDGKPLPERIAECVRAFDLLGVTEPQLVAKTGSPLAEWTPNDVAQMAVIYQSLRRGETTRDREFEPAEEGPTAASITGRRDRAQQPAEPSPPADEPQAGADPEAAAAAAAAAAPEIDPAQVPGSSTREQYAELWSLFADRLGFTRDDKAEARQACEKLIGRQLVGGTMGNLSLNEAGALIKGLGQLGDRGELIVLLAHGILDDDTAEASS